MIRAVAWDIDGTLIDSEPAHHAALIMVSARYGAVIAPDDPRFLGVAMEKVWEIVQALYPANLSQRAWREEIVAAYIATAATLMPMAGAREAVAALRRAGVKQGCVSNSTRRIVEANLARLDFADAFEFAIAREDVVRAKPDPEPYALACRRFGLRPTQILVVEDSDAGAAAAYAAGVRLVLRVENGAFAALLDLFVN